MPAKDFGNKFVCYKCGTKFYDLRRPDPICPKCGADQREAQATKPAEGRRSRLSAQARVVEPIEPAVEPEELVAADGDEADDEVDDSKELMDEDEL